MTERFNWPVLLRAGLYGLRLQPAQFWALTPAELSLMLGAGTRPAMSRSRLNELARLWPDRPRAPVAQGDLGLDGRQSAGRQVSLPAGPQAGQHLDADADAEKSARKDCAARGVNDSGTSVGVRDGRDG